MKLPESSPPTRAQQQAALDRVNAAAAQKAATKAATVEKAYSTTASPWFQPRGGKG